MDLSREYRWMCYKSNEVHKKWKPNIGDYIISKAGYCYNDEVNCTKEEPCIDCLEMDNVFVISGQFDYDKSIGGTHWFFGGGACNKDGGCICNDTFCFVMTESGHSEIQHELYTSSKSKMLWLPRQDQLQQMCNNFIFNCSFVIDCDDSGYIKMRTKVWRNKIGFNPDDRYILYGYSFEQIWLKFVMKEIYKKRWDNKKMLWLDVLDI